MSGKVLMAMSGGIDSTMAAILLIEQAYQLEGVTFRSWDSISKACMERETGCCSVDSIFEAKSVAEKLGFNHQILDIRQLFKDTVISNFISEYLHGRTINLIVNILQLAITHKLAKKMADILSAEALTLVKTNRTFYGNYRKKICNAQFFLLAIIPSCKLGRWQPNVDM